MPETLGIAVLKLETDQTKLKSGLAEAEQKTGKFGKAAGLAGAAGKVAMLGVGVAALAVAAGIAKGVAQAVEFEKGMRDVNTLVGADEAGFKQMQKDLLAMSSEMGLATSTAVPALYQAISSGVPQENVFKFMEDSAKAAIGGSAELADVIGVTTAVIKGYGMSMEDATLVQDQLLTVVKLGVTTLPELAAAMGKVTPLAAALGVPLEELNAGFATLTGVTGNTAEVSTQLRATYQAILKPTREMSEAMNKVATELDAQGKLAGGPLVDAWRDAKEELEKLTEAGMHGTKQYKDSKAALDEAAAALGQSIVQTVGAGEAITMLNETAEGNTDTMGKMWSSVEAVTAVMALSTSQSEAYQEKLAAIEGASGTTAAAFDEMEKSAARQWETLKVKLTNVLTQIGLKILPLVGLALQSLNKIVDIATTFLLDRLIPALEGIPEVIQRDVLPRLQEFREFVTPIIDIFKVGLLPVLDELKVVWTEVFAEIGKVFQETRDELAPVFEELRAMFAPGGGEGISLADAVSVAATVMLTALEIAVPVIVALIRTVGNVIETIVVIATKLISFFTNVFKGEWAAAWQDIVDIGVEIIDFFADQLRIYFGLIKSIAEVFGVDIEAVFQSISDAITGPFVAAIELVKGIWSGALEAMDAILQKVWVGSTISTTLIAWGTALTEGLGGAIDWVKGVWDGALTAMDAALSRVWTVMSGVFDSIKDAFTTFWNFIKPIIGNVVAMLTGGQGGEMGVVASAQKMQKIFLLVLKVISKTAGTYVGNIVRTIKLIIAVGKEVIGFIQNVFKGDWAAAWLNVQNILKAFVDYITSRIDAIIGLVKDVAAVFGVDLQPAIELIESVWKRVMDTIRSAWDTVWGVLKPGLDDANGTVGALQPVLDALEKAWTEIWGTIKEEFSKVWEDMKPLFAELSGIIDSLKDTFGAMFSGLLGNIDDINVKMPAWQAILMAVMDGIVLAIQIATPIIVALIKIIGNTIETLVTVATEVISFFKNVFKGDWEAAFQDIKDIAVAIWDGIKVHFSIVIDAIKAIVGVFGIDLKQKFVDVWNGIKAWFTDSAIPTIKTKAAEMKTALVEWAGDVWPLLKTKVSTLITNLKTWATGTALPAIVTKFTEWKNAAVDWAGDVWALLKLKVTTLLTDLKAWATGTALPAIVTKFTEWKDAAVAWAGAVWPLLKIKVATMLTDIKTWATGTALPAIKLKFSEWRDAAIAWAAEVWPLLKTKAATLLADITAWLTGTALPGVVTKFGEMRDAAVNWIGEVWALLQVKATQLWADFSQWLVGTLIPGVQLKFTELKDAAAAWIADALPTLIVNAGLLWESLSTWFTETLVPNVTLKFTELKDAAAAWLANAIPTLILNAGQLWADLSLWFTETLVPGVKLKFTDLKNAAGSWIADAIPALILNAKQLWTDLSTYFTDTFLPSAKTKMTDLGSQMAKALGDALKAGMKTVANALVSIINSLIDKWNSMEFSIPGFKKEFGGKFGIPKVTLGFDDFTINIPDIPRIPHFAEGAIVTRPTLGIVGEGDHDEAIIPLDGRELGGNTTNLYVLGDIVSEDFVSDLVHKAGVNNDRRGLRRGPQQIGA